MNSDPFWYEHDHDGELEIRSVVRSIDQDSAIIYLHTRGGVPRFHVRVHYPDPCDDTAWCESATFPTLEEAKAFAEKIFFRKQ
jgi:hypothetical protein